MTWSRPRRRCPTRTANGSRACVRSGTLDALVCELDDAERDAVNRREDHTTAYARAVLVAQGPMDIRRYQATLDASDERIAAELAEQRVKGLRRRIDSTKVRIDVGRSVGVALRAETGLAGGPS